MKSMTGFGRSFNRTSKGVELEVSIRAVNGRYLDIRFHLPREYAEFENELKSVLSQAFTRGTLDVYVNRTHKVGVAPEIKVNKDVALGWLKAYQELARTLKLKDKPNLEFFTRVPEVFAVEERTTVIESEKKLLLKTLGEAVASCEAEREREGRALALELISFCRQLQAIALQIETLKTAAKAELEKRMLGRLKDHLREQLQKIGFEGKIDDQRIAQEIVLGLDRTDISEELMRLRAHLDAYLALLAIPEPQGKKLDFYAQELLREINTIGSKSHIAELTSLVVDAKTLIEKIREQVQNAE